MPITPNDPANFTPTMKGYSGQGAFRFWCQTVLPLVYDDSLSYYELLNKVVVYLNNTISDVANMEDNVSGLYTAYTELQGYVNDYFSTLDVQEEINNKLDAMVLSGELSALVGPYIPAAVTDWLAANLYPTEPPIDKTLSIGNAAADSETVGNIFYETTDINNYMNPESRYVVRNGLTIKYLQNGSILINGQAEATTMYILAEDIPVGSYKRGRIVIGGTNQDGTYQIQYRTTHDGAWQNWLLSQTLNVAAETYQIGMKISNGMSFDNWNAFLYIYPATGEAPTSVWNRTAIDYIARNNISKTDDDVEEVRNYINNKLFPITQGNNIISPEAMTLTDGGMTFSFDKSGAVWLNGTAGEDGAFYTLINGFTEAGTYTWKSNRLTIPLTQGNFIIQTSSDGGTTWTRWYRETNYDANIGDLVRINVFANSIANNAGYRIVFWNINNDEPQEDWATTAIDYYAREFNYKCSDELEAGGVMVATGFPSHNYPNFYNYRRQRHLIKITKAPIKVKINEADLSYVSSVNVYQYTASGDNLSFVSLIRGLTLIGGVATYHPEPEITHIKVTLNISDSTHGFQPVEFFSSTPVYTVPNFNTITGGAYKTIEFNYEVTTGVWTKGQLMLPPNYHNEGAKVPLMVYVHGTTRMATWDMVLPGTGENESSETTWRNLWDYMLNEGFAIFDCYPWTSKYYSESTQYSPMPISIHNSAYSAGIKYVCDRYNVNINQVFAMCKSLGGSYGYMLMEQRDIKVKAIAMMAPSTLFTNPKTLEFFQSVYQRTPLLKYLGLENAEGASTFRTTNDGMTNETCVNFVKNNLDLFYPVSYATINAHGTKRDEAIEWIIGLTNTKPQWMIDENLPDWNTTVWSHGMSKMVEHPELTKYTKVPVSYWYSWDDENASPHMAYTAATWLKNGGSNVMWNTVPDNTGKHHSVDNADNAITQSGTTRLGYSYTDVNYVWVECADFFYKYM